MNLLDLHDTLVSSTDIGVVEGLSADCVISSDDAQNSLLKVQSSINSKMVRSLAP